MRFVFAFVFYLLFIPFGNSQKMVFMEKLTNAYCGACPNSAIILDTIVAHNPNTIAVKHHKPVTWIYNPLVNPESEAMWFEIGGGNPLGMIDRRNVNGDILQITSKWESEIINQSAAPAYLNIDILNVAYDNKSRLLSFDVEVVFDAIPTEEGPYNITAMMVEDSVTGQEQHSHYDHVAGHPLEGMGEVLWGYVHRNVVRNILDHHWGTEGIIPNQPVIGESYNHSYTYVIPQDYDAEMFSIVVSVGQYSPTVLFQRKVFNAAQQNLKDLDLDLINSTDEVFSTSILSVSPNPASDFIDISFDTKIIRYQLIDAHGKAILSRELSSKKARIDLHGLSSGVHALLVETENGVYARQFVIR